MSVAALALAPSLPEPRNAAAWPWSRGRLVTVDDARELMALVVRDGLGAPVAARAPVRRSAPPDPPASVVARARDGDATAFRELFRTHRSEVARLVLRLLGRATELEDVVQEVFLQVHRSLKDFRGQSRFSTWLYRVTVNVVLMHRRAARSRPIFVERSEEAARAAVGEALSPDELAARNARLAALGRLLDRLSEKKRTVWVLHELEGVPPAEIAEIVGASVLTVRTRLFYARRDLAALIPDEPALAALAAELQPGRAGDRGEETR